jgi:hypothetical protein
MEIQYHEKRHRWDGFVLNSPHRSIFILSPFLDSLGNNYDLVTCYDKERIVAGAVITKDDSEKPVKFPYPFTMYQGLILADNGNLRPHSRIANEFQVLEFFIGELVHHYRGYSFAQSWRFPDMRPFQWYNYHEPQKGIFKIDLRYTGILELGKYHGFEDYLLTIRSVRRQEYHKGQKNLEIVTSAEVQILDDLHEKTFERQGLKRSPQEASLVRSIARQAISHQFGTLKVALLNGEPASAILYLYDDRTVYYLFGANHPKHRKTGAGTLLVGEMVRNAFARGAAEVDFVGVNSPQRGDYKISFNAELRPYFVASIG